MTNVWKELFHQCALVAYVDEARRQAQWPDSESVRRRAYRLYESELRVGQSVQDLLASSAGCATSLGDEVAS